MSSKPVPSLDSATVPMTGLITTVSIASELPRRLTFSVTARSVCAPYERISCSTGWPTTGVMPASDPVLWSHHLAAGHSSSRCCGSTRHRAPVAAAASTTVTASRKRCRVFIAGAAAVRLSEIGAQEKLGPKLWLLVSCVHSRDTERHGMKRCSGKSVSPSNATEK